MTGLGSSRPLLGAAAFCLTAISGPPARADDGPPPGTYKIRLHQSAGNFDMGANVTSYMVLRSEGTYEIYELTNALRSRGTYVFEPGNAGMPGSLGVVRWKSGLNYDMGRGGSYFTSNPGFNCQHCIVMGRNAVAVLDK